MSTDTKPKPKVSLFKEIVSGWKGFIFNSKEVRKLATVRARICGACEFANPKFIFKLFNDKTKETSNIEGLGCDKCSCLLSAKVRSPLSSCPQDKW